MTLLLALVLMTSINLNLQTCFGNNLNDIIQVASDVQAPTTMPSSNPNSTEEIHDDIVLLDQRDFRPFGYSIFIPVEPFILVSRFIVPLQKPPRV